MMLGKRVNKPKEDGDWNLVSISLYLALWFGLCSIAGFSLSGVFLIGGLANLAGWFALILAVVCLTIWVFSKKDILFTNGHVNNWRRIKANINQFLYANHLYIADNVNSDKIILPVVQNCKSGFKIQALGGLRKKLLDQEIMDELQAYLDNCGVSLFIRESYYDNGWVHFVTGNNINLDGLHF